MRASSWLVCVLVLGACGGDDGDDESSTTIVDTAFSTGGDAAEGDTSEATSTSDASTTGPSPDMGDDGYAGAYGPCEVYSDCSGAEQWVCLVDVTSGGVCAPPCVEHADCPAPEGGNVVPACTEVDGGKNCVLALCEGDADCPEGMTCYTGGPYNRCHWAY